MISAQSGIDFGLVSVYVFWTFFAALILYLRREDRREGYPLEDDGTGRIQPEGSFVFIADPKTYLLANGGTVTTSDGAREKRVLAARRSVVPGSPLVPTGSNPMLDGIGPGSYAERAKEVDLTVHGDIRIVPMRVATDFAVVEEDPDPRGMTVLGTDGKSAGTVKDIWVDRGEGTIRYLEVALASGGQTVLLPITMSLIDKARKRVKVDAITAAQFADVPKLEKPDQVTLYEEERVVAYYGGGFLYATPSRTEPLI